MLQLSVGVRVLVVPFMAIALATPAAAQSLRSWISGVGDDANACLRTAPCRSWAGALTKTLSGGEIDAIDAGSFGPIAITKSVTIDGGESLSGITPLGSNAINVSAGSADVVVIRNMTLDGSAHAPFASPKGVNIVGGKAVLIENCEIFGFQKGIDFEPAGGMTLTVSNSTIHDNTAAGIFVKANGAFFARLTATHLRLSENGHGLMVEDNSLVYVSDSSASNNDGNGFHAQSTFGGAAQLTIENSSSSNNGNAGIVSENVGAVVRILTTTIDHNNGAGLVPLAGGQLLSAGN